jgi:hypothetical protein
LLFFSVRDTDCSQLRPAGTKPYQRAGNRLRTR